MIGFLKAAVSSRKPPRNREVSRGENPGGLTFPQISRPAAPSWRKSQTFASTPPGALNPPRPVDDSTSVAGDQDRQRVRPAGLTDGLRGRAKRLGQIAIGAGFAMGNGVEGFQHIGLQAQASMCKRQIEPVASSLEISGQLCQRFDQEGIAGRAVFLTPAAGRDGPASRLNPDRAKRGVERGAGHGASRRRMGPRAVSGSTGAPFAWRPVEGPPPRAAPRASRDANRPTARGRPRSGRTRPPRPAGGQGPSARRR